MTTSVSDCVDALRRAAEKLGESPTKAQYEDLGFTPASATIIRTVGGWNEAKTKAGLETDHSRGSRVQLKPEDVELPDDLNWAELSVDQRWHYRNKDWNRKRTLRRRERLRYWVAERRRRRGCSQCGETDPGCLDFHHRDGVTKTMGVGTMVTYGYGKRALMQEIAKCDVLCANCHRLHHHSEPRCELRRWASTQKRIRGGCNRCREDRPPCLDFHHDHDDKSRSVSQLITHSRPKDEVLREIEKCTVLCANCHRKEHYRPPQIPTEESAQQEP